MGHFLNITREKEKIGDLGVQLGQLRTARRSLVRRQLHQSFLMRMKLANYFYFT